ncbi:putative pyridoxal-dependent decarboxylase domain-containing protein 2 isoform X1 [Strongylocentrotus purpuratus]|uniref:Pyridoxal-dependent decarboxylase domain-containing protein 1 n=2 Tax=Strongylocentrotus purpuratus TaxID=7668 RepID=A0A7M7NS51_STRPU|nr:putative pyridoxal-dependent decarboxylase domain-containing protein 2 isoform X1 [Strongylocentrotus purpuratus]|eukprot:XP_011675069.1 PREDICTED: putative pyridoxal-dependent decarboxylase domain-containing protein 2 isoform X5 [Strongylocentrotus purpuratus]
MAASVTIGEGATVPATGNVTVKGKNVGKSGGKRNDRAQKLMIEPSLREMSEGLKEVMDQMDSYSKQLDKEREERFQTFVNKSRRKLPGPISNSGQKLDAIIEQLQNIIITSDQDGPGVPRITSPSMLDKAAHIAMLGQSMMAYISTFELDHLRRMATRIVSDTTLWLSRIFRFDESSAYYHVDDREGLARVCRLVLNNKYEKFGTEGFNCLYTKPPIIYISAASRPGLGQYICAQLGLPQSSLCTVPCNTVFGSQHTMDIATLERLIKDDESSSKTPLLVVANAGSPMAGHTDNLNRLRTICDEHNLWLHVEGHNLATLALSTVPSSILAAKRVNSMTIQPGVWLGLPGTPAVTLYKTADPALSLAAGLCSSQPLERLGALPLWLSLQCMGHDGIVSKLHHAAELSQQMSQRLNSLGAINLADKKQARVDKEITLEGSLSEIISRTIQVFSQVDVVSPVVVFKYDDGMEAPGRAFAQYASSQDESDEGKQQNTLPKPTLDAVNTWLGAELGSLEPKIGLDIVEGDQEGVCIRFSPMTSAPYRGTSSEHIDSFVETLKTLISKLNVTIEQRGPFQELASAKENLTVIDSENHAGLGIVQFIPDYLANQDPESEQTKREVNKLNTELVQRLQAGEEASHRGRYQITQTADETVAMAINVVDGDANLEEVLDMICEIGQELEDSSQFLETMSELILKGILEAEKQLEIENENKLIEEGVLRQVPLVGSLYNWFSPPPEAVIKGRTLNLSSGSLESTEKTYKLHMQVQEESASPIKQRPARTPTKPAEEKPAVQKRDLEEAVDPAVTPSETESPATNSLSEGSNATSGSSFQEVSASDMKDLTTESEGLDMK